jgi:hypothetical protein
MWHSDTWGEAEMDDGYDDDGYEDDGRRSQVRGALLKGLGVVVALGLVIAVGTALMVNALGLDEGQASGPAGSSTSGSPSTLPTTALPVPGEKSSGAEPSESATPKRAPKAIRLDASPLQAGAMQRVDLTGSYPGADNTALEVQRNENGSWGDFGVQATVHGGTFATYIMTGHTGRNRLRVLDPATGKASNVVVVTIG